MSSSARISFYYVTQFLPAGAAHAYAGIWLASHGLSGFEISVVTTVPIILILVSNVFVGRLADKARDWRSSLQVLSMVFLLFTAGLFWAESFWPILLCFAGSNVASALAAPIGDAAALHLTSQGRGHIGTLRGLATSGYILALFMTGYAAESFGPTAFIVLSLGFALVRLFASMILPTFKTSEEAASPQLRTGYRALLRPHLFWPLASWSISYATILALNSFLSLHSKQEGYDAKAISWLIAIGAFTEVLMFFAFRKFEHRLDLRVFIAISSAAAVLRWLFMASSPGLAALIALQASHGITYALGFVGCLSFIRRNTTSAEAAEVQSFFNVMQQIAAVIFITAFGAAFDDWGAKTFLLSAVVAGLGCLTVLGAIYMRRETS